jgi:transcriptional regulator with XRE-family HTH domain
MFWFSRKRCPGSAPVSELANICCDNMSPFLRVKMPASSLVDEIRRRSGLSQAELARRAGLPRSVVNTYVRGRREPGTDALIRLASAAGLELQLVPRATPVDAERAGRLLVQVLDLAEALPFRSRDKLNYQRLPNPSAARQPSQ